VCLLYTAHSSGGNACPFVNGTTRLTTPCVNYNPCPVNCTANWQLNGNCTGQCSGGAGFIPEVCFISASASAPAPATAAAAAFKLRSACVPELGAAVLPVLQKTQAVVQHSVPCCRTSPIDTSPHMLLYHPLPVHESVSNASLTVHAMLPQSTGVQCFQPGHVWWQLPVHKRHHQAHAAMYQQHTLPTPRLCGVLGDRQLLWGLWRRRGTASRGVQSGSYCCIQW
jgi:hypothetical protein